MIKALILILCSFVLVAGQVRRPIPTGNGYVEHFDGGSLPASWTAVTSGSSTVTTSDSNVVFTISANAAGFMYRNQKIDKNVHQMHTFCWRTSSLSLNLGIYLVNRSTAPVADTFSGFDGQGITRASFDTSGGIHTDYWNTGGTRNTWDTAGHTWSTTTTLEAVNQFEVDDYVTLTLEIDPNAGTPRFRWLVRGRTASSAFTEAQGERMFAISDWINFSDARTNTDPWLTIGWAYTDQSTTGTQHLEWYRYSEAGAEGKVYGYTNTRNNGGTWVIRPFYTLDYEWWVPVDRTTISINVGAGGQWDDVHVKDQFVIKDGATYWMAYAGDGGSGYEIGMASTTNPAANGWTKSSGNPEIARAAGGDRDQVFRPVMWKDESDADANKRWKMYFAGFSATDSKWRTYYATADTPDGTWTVNTTALIGPSGSANWYERGAVPGTLHWDRANGRYDFFVNGNAGTSGTKWSVGLFQSTGSDPTALTVNGSSPYIPRAADATEVITSQSTRTSNMASTTGFVKDQMVSIDQDTNNANWISARARKITASTSVELYNKPKGLTGGTARMHGWNYGAVDLRAAVYARSRWNFYVTSFSHHSTADGDTFDAHTETTGLLTSTALLDTTKNWEWAATPAVPLGYTAINTDSSNENMVIVTLPLIR